MLEIDDIDQYMKRIVPFGFSGALLIAKGEDILLNQGYGLANRNKGIVNDHNTYFDIGSITKQFTAAAIMKLEMDGRLTTDDLICAYLHSVPHDKKNITLHHLLTHTSGIRDSCGDDYEVLEKMSAVERILTHELFSEPGESFVYSNDGYTLLAAIIEEITKLPYEQYLHMELFLPAQMHWTGYRLPAWDNGTVSNGYVDGLDRGNPLEKDYPYWNLMGNGGMLSTTEDFFKWHRALLGDTILSGDTKKKLYTPYLRNYAYGWDIQDTQYGKLISHDGASTYGTSAYFLRYVDQDLVIVLFSNTAFKYNSISKIVSDKIVKLVFGAHVHFPSKIEGRIESDLTECEQEISLPSGGMAKLIRKNNIIQVSSNDQAALKDLVWTTYDEENVNHLIQLSLTVATDIVEGKYDRLEQLYKPLEEQFESRKSTIQNYLIKHRFGKENNVQVVHFGTVPSNIKKGTIEVRIELANENQSLYLLVFWTGNNISYLGFAGVKLTEVINCVQVNDRLYGYHLGSEKSFEVEL